MKKYILPLLLMFIVGACKKDTYYTSVEGIVINSGTKKPIDSVRIILKDGVGGSNTTGFGLEDGQASDKKSITYTNKDGSFFVELTGKHTAYLAEWKDKYHFNKSNKHPNWSGVLPYSEGKNTDVVIELDAEAYFSCVLYSENARKEDTFQFGFQVNGGVTEVYSSDIRQFLGKGPHKIYRESDPSTLFGADKYFYYSFELKRNNEITSYLDSVYIESFETWRDTIFY